MNSSSTANTPAMPATPNLWEEWLRTLIEGYPTKEWIEENFTLKNIERLCALPHTQEQASRMLAVAQDIRWAYAGDETITEAADDLINRLASELP